MVGRTLRNARTAAGITGQVLCKKAAISRSRLSEIERDYRPATASEQNRLSDALAALISARNRIDAFAVEVGWPTGVS